MAFTPDDLRALVRALARDPEATAELARLLAEHFLRELRDEIRAIAEAQRRTDQHLEALAEAQRRTEERVGKVEERVGRVEEQLALLTEAQRRTEERVEALAEAQRELTETVGRLAHDVAILKGMSLQTH